jgi:hypothetical protein
MSNFQIIVPVSTLAASGSYTFDVDTFNFQNSPVTIGVSATYASLLASGLVVNCYAGCGNSDPTANGTLPIVIGGSNVPIYETGATTYQLSSGSSLTNTDFIEVLCYMVPRWVRFVISNPDPANPATIKVVGDIP